MTIVIDRNSKILFWVFAFLLSGAILFSAHRFLVVNNFLIDISQIESAPEEIEEPLGESEE